MAPSSALPIGGTRILSEMQPVLIDPSQTGSGLLNAVLALLAPLNPDESETYDEEILDLNVTGFLVMSAPLLHCAVLLVYRTQLHTEQASIFQVKK
jgi:polyribonucleotide 5'-hydroxyl-kinase